MNETIFDFEKWDFVVLYFYSYALHLCKSLKKEFHHKRVLSGMRVTFIEVVYDAGGLKYKFEFFEQWQMRREIPMDGKRTEFENGIPSAKKLFFVCAFQICSSFFPSLTLLLKSFIQNFLHLAVNG